MPTSASLFDRLKAAGPDASDWNRLHAVYLPLIERWLGRVPGLGAESADKVAEETGLSVNAVVQAKSRIHRRLREEAGELLA